MLVSLTKPTTISVFPILHYRRLFYLTKWKNPQTILFLSCKEKLLSKYFLLLLRQNDIFYTKLVIFTIWARNYVEPKLSNALRKLKALYLTRRIFKLGELLPLNFDPWQTTLQVSQWNELADCHMQLRCCHHSLFCCSMVRNVNIDGHSRRSKVSWHILSP